jgi:hypothetical protein
MFNTIAWWDVGSAQRTSQKLKDCNAMPQARRKQDEGMTKGLAFEFLDHKRMVRKMLGKVRGGDILYPQGRRLLA